MEKTFGMVKVGDRIYQTTINDSSLVKDAKGGAFIEFIVKEIEDIDFYHLRFTLNKLKITYDKGYIETEETKNNILVIEVERNAYIHCVDTKPEDEFDLTINRVFYAATKNKVKECVLKVLDIHRQKAEELYNLSRTVKDRCWVSHMEVGCTPVEEEKEPDKEYSLEEAASMAM